MAFSCEPKRSSLRYSDDLRWKITHQKEALELPVLWLPKNLSVNESTVRRISILFQRTGGVQKKQYPVERTARKITSVVQYFILQLVVKITKNVINGNKRYGGNGVRNVA